jgi:hypothetical protein
MHQVRRSIAIFLCVTAVLVLASPLALYCLGLSGVGGRPQKPLQLVSKEQQELVWKRARAKSMPRIEAMNPYSFVIKLLVKKDASTPPDQLIVWRVASGYLLSHQRYQGMSWWHLSGAALTIWSHAIGRARKSYLLQPCLGSPLWVGRCRTAIGCNRLRIQLVDATL